MNYTKQQGTAIIVAIFIMALVATIAVSLLERLSINMRRTELILNDYQATLYTDGSIAWAKDHLIQNYKNQQQGKIIDKMPITSPVDTINGAKIFTLIEDAQGAFNLNNLIDSHYQAIFTRLIQVMDPKADAVKITQATTDWISRSNQVAFDAYYAKLDPPYRAPHRPMMSISEWRLVQGVTPELYTLLSPYLTALPDNKGINVNTASIPLLMSMIPTLTTESAKAIVDLRQQTPFMQPQDFLNLDSVLNKVLFADIVEVKSAYFLVKTTVMIGDQERVIYTLLERIVKNNQPEMITLSQSKGTL